MKISQLCKELEDACQNAYEGGVEVTDAEKLAARALQAQIILSRELEKLDLDSRMKKNGVKAIKAAVYLEEVRKADKKPSDTMLEQICNLDKSVADSVEAHDQAEASREGLERYLGIFKDAHVFFRNVARGVMG